MAERLLQRLPKAHAKLNMNPARDTHLDSMELFMTLRDEVSSKPIVSRVLGTSLR
jgi:hypothetical protein